MLLRALPSVCSSSLYCVGVVRCVGESTSPGMFHIPLTRSCVYTWRKSSVKLSCMHFVCKGMSPLCDGEGVLLEQCCVEGTRDEW